MFGLTCVYVLQLLPNYQFQSKNQNWSFQNFSLIYDTKDNNTNLILIINWKAFANQRICLSDEMKICWNEWTRDAFSPTLITILTNIFLVSNSIHVRYVNIHRCEEEHGQVISLLISLNLQRNSNSKRQKYTSSFSFSQIFDIEFLQKIFYIFLMVIWLRISTYTFDTFRKLWPWKYLVEYCGT